MRSLKILRQSELTVRARARRLAFTLLRMADRKSRTIRVRYRSRDLVVDIHSGFAVGLIDGRWAGCSSEPALMLRALITSVRKPDLDV